MKLSKLKKYIRQALKEQDFTGDPFDKDLTGGCLDKTPVNFPTSYVGLIDNISNAFMAYTSAGNPDMPAFLISSQAANMLAEYMLMQTSANGGNVLDYSIDMSINWGNEGENLESPEPWCPYAYVPWLDMGFTCNASGTACPDGVIEFQAQNTGDVIAFFCSTFPMMCVNPFNGEVNIPLTLLQLYEILSTHPANDGSIAIAWPDSVQLQLRDCEWEDFIWGCTDPTAYNYDSNATSDDGSCLAPCSLLYTLPDVMVDTVCLNCCSYSDEEIAANTFQYGNAIDNDLIGECPCCGSDELNENWRELYCTEGCMDEIANNYNPGVIIDDGSCEYNIGCMEPGAFNFDPEAVMPCIDCCVPFIFGCMDETAINYNPDANMNQGGPFPITCYYVEGCTDLDALNYNPDSDLDDGSCVFVLGCMDETALNFNPEADSDDGSQCYYVSGCMDPNAVNFNPEADNDDLSCCYISGCMEEGAFNYDEEACIQPVGACIPTVIGCMDPLGCNYNPSANTPGYSDVVMDLDPSSDGTCDYASCYGCLNPSACNYDAAFTFPDLNQCEFETCSGCMNDLACNYDPTATIDNGLCEWDSCYGCMDAGACNFDPNANNDVMDLLYDMEPGEEGIDMLIPYNYWLNQTLCEYNSCVGCMEAGALNYDSTATIPCEDCCEFKVGCMDPVAENYDSEAIIPCEDCCEYIIGCMDPNASNYNPEATLQPDAPTGPDDMNTYADICVYDDETDPLDPGTLDPIKEPEGILKDPVTPERPEPDQDLEGGTPWTPPGDKPLDQKPGYQRPTGLDKPETPQDLIPLPRPGCMDENACNYNPNANVENNSCEYPGDECAEGTVEFGGITIQTQNTGIWDNQCTCEGDWTDITMLSYCNEVYAGGTTNPNPNWGEAAPGGPIGVCLPDCPNFSCQECANNFIVASTWGNVYNIFVDGNTSGQEDVDWPTNMCGGMQYWLNQESYIDEPIDGEGGPPEPDFTPKPDLDSQPLIPINESRLVKRFKKLANIKNKK